MVLACLAVLLPFIASFNYDARVEWQSSINNADEVKARNLERGALRLSVMLFELQRAIFNQKDVRKFMGSIDITLVAPYLMSMFGDKEGAEGIGSLVGVNTTALSSLAVSEGTFDVRLEAESGKINVNCFAGQGDGEKSPKARMVQMLGQLMQPLLYEPLFDEEKHDGYRYTREEILAGIVDFVDDDNYRYDVVRSSEGKAPEQYRYNDLYDNYAARNARFDTIEELHLVQGIDDDWMAAFGSQLTVYGSCKVNLNFASAEQIALVLKHAVSSRDIWKTEGENFLLMTMPLANFVVMARAFSLYDKLDEVKTLVGKPDTFLPPAFLRVAYESQDPAARRVPDGMEVRVNEGCRDESCWGGMRELATVEPERIYRIEVTANVGAARKRLVAVYDMQAPRANSPGKGAWLYYREE